MQLLNAILRVNLVDTHAVIKSSQNQLHIHHVSQINWHSITTHLVLVPEQYQLVLVPSHQDRVNDETHSYRFLVVARVLNHNVQRISLDQQAG